MTRSPIELDNKEGHIGLKIQAVRKIIGLTQKDLAKKSGVAYATLTKVEAGVIVYPSYKVIEALSDTLGIPLGALTKSFDITEGYSYGRYLLKESGEKTVFTAGTNRKGFVEKGLGDMILSHKKELQKMKIKKMSLAQEGDTDFILPSKSSVYRWLPKNILSKELSVAVYGEYIAVTSLEHNLNIKWKNPVIVDVYKKQFLFMWNSAKRIPDKELQKKIKI